MASAAEKPDTGGAVTSMSRGLRRDVRNRTSIRDSDAYRTVVKEAARIGPLDEDSHELLHLYRDARICVLPHRLPADTDPARDRAGDRGCQHSRRRPCFAPSTPDRQK